MSPGIVMLACVAMLGTKRGSAASGSDCLLRCRIVLSGAR